MGVGSGLGAALCDEPSGVRKGGRLEGLSFIVWESLDDQVYR